MAESNSGAGNSVQGFQFLQQKGDLFSCAETDSLAHCVSEDVRMGKGIAVIFKKQFGGVQELKDQGKKTGDVAVLRRGKRFVYYLITKEKANGKPGYDSLRSSLVALRKRCTDDKVTSLSMPRIGCGLDGLQWDKVSTMICDVFSDTNMTITIYTL